MATGNNNTSYGTNKPFPFAKVVPVDQRGTPLDWRCKDDPRLIDGTLLADEKNGIPTATIEVFNRRPADHPFLRRIIINVGYTSGSTLSYILDDWTMRRLTEQLLRTVPDSTRNDPNSMNVRNEYVFLKTYGIKAAPTKPRECACHPLFCNNDEIHDGHIFCELNRIAAEVALLVRQKVRLHGHKIEKPKNSTLLG